MTPTDRSALAAPLLIASRTRALLILATPILAMLALQGLAPGSASAQEPAAPEASGAAAEAPPAQAGKPKAAAKPKPVPKPVPKPAPKPKPVAKPDPKPEPKAEPTPKAAAKPAPEPAPVPVAPPAGLNAAMPSPVCGAQAARYEGDKGFALWVTRKGRAEIENPLRPLTPEVSEVLQVTIAGKAATAYGPDLRALRRGPAPGALEAQVGAPIRWEAALPALPDPITIVSEAGETLARLGFRECTEAPPVKAAPEAKGKEPKGKEARAARRTGEAGAPAGKPAAKAVPKAPPGFSLPQGAIGE
jgi:outer membrane biosynthesis protein TonB